LKAEIEATPPGRRRDGALQRIAPLGEEPFTVDKQAAQDWWALASKSKATAASYRTRLAEMMIKTGCIESGAPYVSRGVLRQLENRFEDEEREKAAVANAFLNPNCPGARVVRRRQSEPPPSRRPTPKVGPVGPRRRWGSPIRGTAPTAI